MKTEHTQLLRQAPKAVVSDDPLEVAGDCMGRRMCDLDEILADDCKDTEAAEEYERLELAAERLQDLRLLIRIDNGCVTGLYATRALYGLSVAIQDFDAIKAGDCPDPLAGKTPGAYGLTEELSLTLLEVYYA